ncbi:S9 family peptidase [filamentous cyanobacterium LEGE 11480]|uniref:S9 family peptidase n=1 Tax=Romeriopsis navalis LEGE 11480 TaxID=2777977 RepID=A0A928VMD0_9CYAN|nr:prolyl oligopeptidase family serine peptidase [Romeriopsis navalis]MBE9030353.1 S9 family peptidase [Romeriopsis navalis LEGE 11480]
MSAHNQATWQNPPEPIVSMLDAPQLPAVSISPDNQWIIELDKPSMPPIAQLAEPVVAIAGGEINPNTWGPGREAAYEGMTLRRLDAATAMIIELPPTPRIRNLSWSRDCRYLAFTLTQTDGIELWILDVAQAKARPLTQATVNATNGRAYAWLPGDEGLICQLRPQDIGPPPEESPVPQGPVIESSAGRVAPARTYTNLLKNPHDEALLDYYFCSQVVHISLTGTITPIGDADLIRNVVPSADGQWLLRSTYHRPFSYQVPLGRFPIRYEVLNRRGEIVYEVADLPLADNIPVAFDAVRPGRRNFSWRHDAPATLVWVEALDGGDPRTSAEYRDAVFSLAAPFTDAPQQLWQSTLRFRGITWGHRTLALIKEFWYDSRKIRTWRIDPSNPQVPPRLLQERDAQDAYTDPGDPVTVPGSYGWSTLLLADSTPNESIYLNGGGASPAGVFPFLDRYDLTTGATERLWQAQGENYTRISRVLDAQATELIIRQQSQTTPPNYCQLNRTSRHTKPVTQFDDKLAWYADVQKEVVRYDRADGVTLSATLYLPPEDGTRQTTKLPTILWVYPEEFKDRQVASQVTRSEYTFTRPSGSSILFLLTQGYAVLAGPTMPIIGEGEREPNDTYIEQLVSSAEAAVSYLVDRGVADPDRVAIGGHSYGAFTATNLLAHCDLFRAGIARSGAYNRSLTPFGFQGEQRSFWEATETYIKLSPFVVADQIQSPLLLIHGAEDNNPGTFPIQTERLYEAMRGLGGTVRYVSLPAESHGYRARESVGHVLWEMVQWLDEHLKLPSTDD